ncbi:aspartate--tRNA ligase [Mycoplasmopsis bovis]|uniref:Aspartate--tRNA ligase n=3 Tax=Mycoplasmopsis bovis TaxID=28903 RepID=A0A2N8U234_MYCBV|nr:aspartate--tRNA ligase [Mycoplasmopsis bovis]ADR24892.1 aspartate--tRNA ligase [Mycoplasmopsis bovis PG45]AEI90013.1 aspartyl-tRNA synthetase (aspartate-tRNA ligase) (AspRS) [Mycoplasmopsis bovis Hubei-1]AFM51690.1 aspartyl-tRNA synthetase [Mycoplasmopsis bovis HB0801]AIA33887.1 aspartyl-tRNA ligase [Mycoplasmopsis bovis CQ-W70]AKO50514.1 aspartyl-tRNA synthetase [Mycoplasmopsis bovis]
MKSKYIKNGLLTKKNLGEKIALYGWVSNKRRFGPLTFIDLRDRYGIVQCVFEKDLNVTKESVMYVEGTVVKRLSPNSEIPTGDIEIKVSKHKVLSQSVNELPFAIRDDIDVREEIKLKYRYLDLRRPEMQKTIMFRAKIMHEIRNFLYENEFIEIETPTLAKSTPEGARDFLVATRNKGQFWALPQSPQLFKQLLMISGFEKYYQIARCYRDEDSRKDRQPEFVQLDIETSFLNVDDFHKIIEKLVKRIMSSAGIKVKTPFLKIKYADAIKDYGSDKPDLRYEYKITDINDFCNETDFAIIKDAKSKRMLFVDSIVNKKEFSILEEIAKKNKANILFYFTVVNGEISQTNFAKKVPLEAKKLINENDNKDGTYFVVANTYENASQALGAVRVELNNMFNYAKDEYRFAWIVDWPMFEFNEDENKWDAAHHPFTRFAHTLDELDKLSIDKINAIAYDLVLNGFEIAGGSARIYDKNMQEKMFNLIGLTKEQQESKFGWFLKAFDYGVPPHCGIAFGLDRLIMLLAHQKSIRDVIPFPKNSKNQDLLMDAPSDVTMEQLDELGLVLKDE